MPHHAERDPAFQQTCEEKLPKNKKIIVYCGLGGTLDVGALPYKPGGKSFKDDPERMFGRESRSLKAIYELLQVIDHTHFLIPTYEAEENKAEGK